MHGVGTHETESSEGSKSEIKSRIFPLRQYSYWLDLIKILQMILTYYCDRVDTFPSLTKSATLASLSPVICLIKLTSFGGSNKPLKLLALLDLVFLQP